MTTKVTIETGPAPVRLEIKELGTERGLLIPGNSEHEEFIHAAKQVTISEEKVPAKTTGDWFAYPMTGEEI